MKRKNVEISRLTAVPQCVKLSPRIQVQDPVLGPGFLGKNNEFLTGEHLSSNILNILFRVTVVLGPSYRPMYVVYS